METTSKGKGKIRIQGNNDQGSGKTMVNKFNFITQKVGNKDEDRPTDISNLFGITFTTQEKHNNET